jgi:hypothetical protein
MSNKGRFNWWGSIFLDGKMGEVNPGYLYREQMEDDTLDLQDEIDNFVRKVGIDEGGFNI